MNDVMSLPDALLSAAQRSSVVALPDTVSPFPINSNNDAHHRHVFGDTNRLL